MTLFDYLVLTVLLLSVLIGVLRGLVREMLSLLGWIAALVVANTWGAQMAAWLPVAVPGTMVRLIVGFLILFVATLLLASLVTMAISQLVKSMGLQVADRGLGGLFGLARGVLIVLVVVILGGLTAMPQQPFWRNSLFAPLAETGVRTLKPWLPGSWAEHVHY